MCNDKIHDMLLRLEVDLQTVKDAIFYAYDIERAKTKLASINQQSKNITEFLKAANDEN